MREDHRDASRGLLAELLARLAHGLGRTEEGQRTRSTKVKAIHPNSQLNRIGADGLFHPQVVGVGRQRVACASLAPEMALAPREHHGDAILGIFADLPARIVVHLDRARQEHVLALADRHREVPGRVERCQGGGRCRKGRGGRQRWSLRRCGGGRRRRGGRRRGRARRRHRRGGRRRLRGLRRGRRLLVRDPAVRRLDNLVRTRGVAHLEDHASRYGSGCRLK
mmetsp:Transcript_161551/g.513427  ORF Transcript_161551/g.513427 Transcript_161551/m.513427 type:complete len:223 (-) Transcript_161551:464-1132(-)